MELQSSCIRQKIVAFLLHKTVTLSYNFLCSSRKICIEKKKEKKTFCKISFFSHNFVQPANNRSSHCVIVIYYRIIVIGLYRRVRQLSDFGEWFGGALHNCQASQSSSEFSGHGGISALAGAVINYKRWSVINSNCNWIAFMPSLWNIRPPVPVADSLWWGVLVTWIISPWAPQRTSGLSLHMCICMCMCVHISLGVCGICVRGRGLARVSGVATSQPRKSYPLRERERAEGTYLRRIDSGWIPFRPREYI